MEVVVPELKRSKSVSQVRTENKWCWMTTSFKCRLVRAVWGSVWDHAKEYPWFLLENRGSRVEIFPMSRKQYMQMECGGLLELVTRAIGSSPSVLPSLPPLFLRALFGDINCAYSILPPKRTNAQVLCNLVYIDFHEEGKTMGIPTAQSP